MHPKTTVPPTETAGNLAGYVYAAAASAPEREALVCDEATLTYAAFRDRIEALRPALRDAGPFVGILAHKSPTAYAGVQAILAEGRAYVPMNPAFPAARNAYILTKASLDTLIVGEECAEALAALLRELDRPVRIVAWSDAARVAALLAGFPLALPRTVTVRENAPPSPLAAVPADGSAYVLFTSGSTGKPKGVRVRHDNVRSYVASFLAEYPIHPWDRCSQTFDLTFDVSVHDQFATFAAGATLVSFPDKALLSPLGYAAARRITIWFSVPALAAFLESARQVIPGALPDVRLSLFAGEKLTWKTCALWRTVAPNSRLANLYGPTEATIAVTHFAIPDGYPEERCHQGGIPIGRAWERQRAEVRREDGSLCADGELGGLWLAGDQIAPGYLGEDKMTAERFIARHGEMWYRTGDLVFREPDGTLQFQGREDFQVKVMGYRIELGEIEHALMRVTGAPFAIAGVAALRNGLDEIFCVLPAAHASRRKEIKAALKDCLPAYMLPRHLFFRDDIPLNASGKMDRGALRGRLIAEATAQPA
jgi:amino acid adenylation domain-containing protein